MENVITVSKPKPHEAQVEVLSLAKRFNCVANGRRWGKTNLAVKLAMETMLKGEKVGYFVPSPDFWEDFWEEIKARFEDITVYKSETKRILRINTGGQLNMFSLEKKRAGRGKKFHRAIIDEGAFVKDLKESWEKVIRATLADYAGDAWFFSTPLFGVYFHILHQNAGKKGFEDWRSFQMPTSSNPYMTKAELAHIKSQLDPLTFAQEYEAKFVNLTGNRFAHCFKKEKHVKSFGNLKKTLPVYLSFDFNASPMTCIASQHAEDHSWIYTRHEFRIMNSDIYEMCREIKTKLPGHYFIITGDKSGDSKTGLNKNLNYYVVIKKKLKLANHQVVLPKKNPFHKDSRVLCNSILFAHPAIYIHPDCTYLIQDMELVQILANGEIDKKTNKDLTHLLDAWRYYINSFFKTFIKL